MNPCPRWREELLRADAAILGGRDPAPLGRHLAECAGCAAAARAILGANAALDATLSEHPPFDAEALLEQAGEVEALLEEAGESEHAPVASLTKNARTARRARWAVGALAASVAMLLLVRGADRPLPGTPPVPLGAPAAEIEAPAGVNVAVFQTGNPDITVLWLYSGG